MKNEKYCSFCGKKITDIVLSGNTGCICSDCINVANIYLKNTNNNLTNNINKKSIPKPKEIKKFLDNYVIGQDSAKEKLSIAVYNHYKRINSNICDDEIELEKSNVLMIGNTGTGKTHLVKTIAKLLDVPFVIVDATAFTQAGYVGEDVESIISRLLQVCDYNVAKAENGIVFIDEVDKLSAKSPGRSITKDVNGEGVQQSLLKLLEGSDILCPPEGGRKHPEQPGIKVNTKNILFICGGAFVGLNDIVNSKFKKINKIGFNFNNESSKINEDEWIKNIEVDDLKQFGLIPEFLGRLPIITYTEELSKETLKDILLKPKNSLIKQYTKLFEIDGIKLSFNDEIIDYIVDKAYENKLGARGLRSIIENIMTKPMFELPSKKLKKYNVSLKDVV